MTCSVDRPRSTASRGRGVVYRPWHWICTHCRLKITEAEICTATSFGRLWKGLFAKGVPSHLPTGNPLTSEHLNHSSSYICDVLSRNPAILPSCTTTPQHGYMARSCRPTKTLKIDRNFEQQTNSQISNSVESILGDYDLRKTFRLLFLHHLHDGMTGGFSVWMSLAVIAFQRSYHQRQALSFIQQHTTSFHQPATQMRQLFAIHVNI